MKINVFIVLLFPFFSFSQEIIRGKIKTETPEISGILVVNLTHQSETRTDGLGRFSIKAEIGDLLIISASHIHKRRHLVEKQDFEKELEIEIEALPLEIESIEIVRSDITSESLGLVSKGQKRYTPAERRLKTAADPDLEFSYIIPTLRFSLDPLLNAISGRTKMLKKELEIERFNKDVMLTENYLSDELLISKFDIPKEYVKSFRMFLVDNPDFMKVMIAKDNDNIISKAFYLSEVFQKIILDEQ